MTISSNIIWISSNENNEIINKFLKELETSKFYKVHLFNSIEESIKLINKIRFEETIIIVDGNLYIKFVEIFHNNLNNIYIIPKIIIFQIIKKNL